MGLVPRRPTKRRRAVGSIERGRRQPCPLPALRVRSHHPPTLRPQLDPRPHRGPEALCVSREGAPAPRSRRLPLAWASDVHSANVRAQIRWGKGVRGQEAEGAGRVTPVGAAKNSQRRKGRNHVGNLDDGGQETDPGRPQTSLDNEVPTPRRRPLGFERRRAQCLPPARGRSGSARTGERRPWHCARVGGRVGFSLPRGPDRAPWLCEARRSGRVRCRGRARRVSHSVPGDAGGQA